MFAYGGYETALMLGGEAENPKRDYPFALLCALVVCTLIYTMTQWIIISVVPAASMTERPMATAAKLMLGPWGAGIVSFGVLISCYGYLSANILGFPRILFAQAEQGDMPQTLARVHSKFRTPHLAIVIFSIALWGFSLAGGFQWNVTISAMSRLIYYGSVCAALPFLRRKKNAPQAEFHLPMGDLVALLAVGVSLLLFPHLDRPRHDCAGRARRSHNRKHVSGLDIRAARPIRRRLSPESRCTSKIGFSLRDAIPFLC